MEKVTIYKCENCDWYGTEMAPVVNESRRYDPGCTVAEGECPECGALCFPFLMGRHLLRVVSRDRIGTDRIYDLATTPMSEIVADNGGSLIGRELELLGPNDSARSLRWLSFPVPRMLEHDDFALVVVTGWFLDGSEPRHILKDVRQAVTAWVLETVEGKQAWYSGSSENFNVGDLATVYESTSLLPYLAAVGCLIESMDVYQERLAWVHDEILVDLDRVPEAPENVED